ncbi:MAG: hypothetical protein P9M01_04220 [Candidatus Kappaea frigidicola]|nr:hypothetical protein [Candidatus Kappaea frigidicola]
MKNGINEVVCEFIPELKLKSSLMILVCLSEGLFKNVSDKPEFIPSFFVFLRMMGM